MKYLTVDLYGNITGAYWQDVRPEHASSYVEVTDDGVYSNWTKYRYVNSQFEIAPIVSVPTPLIPTSVTRRQFKLALLGIDLLDDVEAMISASGDRALQINWEEALEFERGNPFVAQMTAALGKTEADVDALFILAATL